MKSTLTTIILLLIGFTMFAQQGINYKAILKDTNGNVLSNTFMNVQFSIHQTTATGTIVYQEDRNYTTNESGLIIHSIGTEPTPSIGVFTAIDWSVDLHFLQISITYSGGTIDFDATEFMAVPYAKHATTAANVFSGDYNDLINQPTTLPTGLEQITEGGNTGWRLIGSDPNNYADIGENAIDLSYNDNSGFQAGATGDVSTAMGIYSIASGNYSTAMGSSTTASGNYATAMGFATEASGNYSTATGRGTESSGGYSTAMGEATIASGNYSIAMGYSTTASGDYSSVMGIHTNAESYASLAIGRYNVGGGSDITWSDSNPLFEIGNGFNSDNRNNALTVLKNGKTGIGIATPSSLLEVAHKNGSPEAESLSVLNTDTNNSWQFHTTSYLNLYRNGVFKGSWNATSGAYVQASDRRVKKDIIPLDNGTLNKVMQLNPVSYLMKDQTDSKRNLGLISQEVKELFPSITHYVKDSDLLALSYTELIPILIKAIQEQQAIIENQNNKIEQQSMDKADTDKTLQALLKRVETIEGKQSN